MGGYPQASEAPRIGGKSETKKKKEKSRPSPYEKGKWPVIDWCDRNPSGWIGQLVFLYNFAKMTDRGEARNEASKIKILEDNLLATLAAGVKILIPYFY